MRAEIDIKKLKRDRNYAYKMVDKAGDGKKLTDVEVEEIACKFERAIGTHNHIIDTATE